MTGKKIGYIRVSSVDQNTDRQLDSLELDKIFIDKCSAVSTKRPQLENMLSFIREDDVIYVHSLDRLARSMRDMTKIKDFIIAKKCKLVFVKENLVFTENPTPMEELILNVFTSVYQFERSISKERQREGIEKAKKAGKYEGRKKVFTLEQQVDINEKIKLGIPKSRVARQYGVSHTTIYKYIDRSLEIWKRI